MHFGTYNLLREKSGMKQIMVETICQQPEIRLFVQRSHLQREQCAVR